MVMSLRVFPFPNPSLSLSCAVLLFNRCCLFIRIHSYRFLGPGQPTDFNQLPKVTETFKVTSWKSGHNKLSILIKSSRIDNLIKDYLRFAAMAWCQPTVILEHHLHCASFRRIRRRDMIGQECPDSDFLLYRNSWGESCNAHGSSGNFEDRIEG